MKERNYEALVAGMHKKETFEGAEEVIKKDFKLKLPDRRYIPVAYTHRTLPTNEPV